MLLLPAILPSIPMCSVSTTIMNTVGNPIPGATTAAVTDIAGIIEKCDNITEL